MDDRPLLAVEQADGLEPRLRFAVFPGLRRLDRDDPARFIVDDDVPIHLQLPDLRLLPCHRIRAAMWPVPKNVSSASRSPSAATVFRRRVSLCPRRFVRFAAMNFFDRDFEVFQEIGPDRALRVRVGSGRERYLRGERARDRASLPRGRAVDPWMLEEDSMFRRPGPGPQMSKQGALRTEEVDRPGGRPPAVP